MGDAEPDVELQDLEREICRLPDISAARIVVGDAGQPVEVHVLALPGKHPKQVVRDIQSVALAATTRRVRSWAARAGPER